MLVKGINKVRMNIDEPIKFTNIELEYKDIGILAGPNGSGKTFVLVNVFCLQTLFSVIAIGGITDDAVKRSVAQMIWDKSFDDQNINGTVGGLWGINNEFNLEVTFVKGDVTKVEHSDLSQISQVSSVMYLSSHMRTFDAIKMYLKIRKMIKESCQPTHDSTDELLEKLSKDFKLYDISYLEAVISQMPITPDPIKKQALEKFDKFFTEIKEIDVDFEKCDFIITKNNGDTVSASSLSKGIQSMLNMSLLNL